MKVPCTAHIDEIIEEFRNTILYHFLRWLCRTVKNELRYQNRPLTAGSSAAIRAPRTHAPRIMVQGAQPVTPTPRVTYCINAVLCLTHLTVIYAPYNFYMIRILLINWHGCCIHERTM